MAAGAKLYNPGNTARSSSAPRWHDGRSESELTPLEREWFYEVNVLAITDMSPLEYDQLTLDQIDAILAGHAIRQYQQELKDLRASVSSMSLKEAERVVFDLPLEEKDALEKARKREAYEKLKADISKPAFLPDYEALELIEEAPEWLNDAIAMGIYDMNRKGYFKEFMPVNVAQNWGLIKQIAQKVINEKGGE